MDSYVSDIQYKMNENNHIISAIHPLNTIINKTSTFKSILGGSIHTETEKARFEDLGVPVGLYLPKKHKGEIENLPRPKNANKEALSECRVIDDKTFNALIEKIAKKNRAKTLKLREPVKEKKTRRK